ncbi:hypothetical protein Nmel_008683, partial [Mimus melanotis]
ASAALSRPSARPGAARREPGAHGGGGGAGRRRGAAALLPVAAVHGGAGAAARLPPALVPPHRRGRAARRAAAAGPHPQGKAGAAGRAGPGREERRSLTVPVPAAGGGGERARRGHPHRGLRDPVPLFFPPGMGGNGSGATSSQHCGSNWSTHLGKPAKGCGVHPEAPSLRQQRLCALQGRALPQCHHGGCILNSAASLEPSGSNRGHCQDSSSHPHSTQASPSPGEISQEHDH